MIKVKITYDSPFERDKLRNLLSTLGINKIEYKSSKNGFNYIQFNYYFNNK